MGKVINIGKTYQAVRITHMKKDMIYFLAWALGKPLKITPFQKELLNIIQKGNIASLNYGKKRTKTSRKTT